ncbi:MAG: choice-of-anchor B family protein, partial [Phaeodactylibacter sp.]|nr:choice-of-anchor B family protein [Phaeodactylibacter sp.]
MRIACLFFFMLTAASTMLSGQDALNIDLFGQYNPGDGRASGSWSYVGGDGKEYALLGGQTGTRVVEIGNAGSLTERAFIPGPPSNWREITVVGDHAYVVTEGSANPHPGMQVIDLSNLPGSAELVTTYNTVFNRGHIIQKDIFEDQPYVFVCGTTTTSGVHIIDISNPEAPQQAGLYQPGYYIHDCHVRGDILFAAAFYEGTMDILDISNPANPVLLNRMPYPGGNTHSMSTTLDMNYLFLCDEQDGLVARMYDISDLTEPVQVATYTANIQSLVHNPYIRGDFIFITHNTEGLRVLDITDPEVPVEVGYYDTFAGQSGGFSGLWSACPYLPSGKILGGNREDGLYVWEFNNTKAGRFYGEVLDSITGEPLVNAVVTQVSGSGFMQTTDFDGLFAGGSLSSTITLSVERPGYLGKTVEVSLEAGNGTNLSVELQPVISSI